jgi:hypothetical protein
MKKIEAASQRKGQPRRLSLVSVCVLTFESSLPKVEVVHVRQ